MEPLWSGLLRACGNGLLLRLFVRVEELVELVAPGDHEHGSV